VSHADGERVVAQQGIGWPMAPGQSFDKRIEAIPNTTGGEGRSNATNGIKWE